MAQVVRRMDLVLVDFGNDIIGSEQGGKRMALVIQNDVGNTHSSTTIVMPLTSKIKNLSQPTHGVLIPDRHNKLHKKSMILGECLRQISEQRILKRVGAIENEADKAKIRNIYMANFGE